jgi:K+-sensing histidine kinase KdpD
MLGARLRVEEGEDVAAVAIEVARALGSTYVLMGTPSPRRGLGRLGGPLPDRSLMARLLRGLPGVDLRIVTDPGLRSYAGAAEEPGLAGGLARESDEPLSR